MVNLTRLLVSSFIAILPALAADNPAPVKQTKANYELAAQWTPAKMGKLVLEASVTAHWLEQGDRFWYTFENSKGRKFYIVDPVKKTRSFRVRPGETGGATHRCHGLALRIAASAHHHHSFRQERYHHPV